MKSLLLLGIFIIPFVQAAPLGGPVPGYTLDSRTNTIRPILGIPGAMQFGAAVELPFGVVAAEFSADGSFAVAISDESQSHLYVIRNLSAPAIVDLGEVPDHSSLLGISASGASAILASPGQFQFLTGMPGSPAISAAVSAAPLLGPVGAGVVTEGSSDALPCALVGTSRDGSGALETLCADGSTQRFLVQAGLTISALALSNGGRDAILADTAGQRVLRLADYTQSPTPAVLATAADAIVAPLAIQIQGEQAIVADASVSSLFVVDLTGRMPVQAASLSVVPTRLCFLADRSILLLNDTTAAPFIVFHLPSMQSYFVPAN